MHRLDLHRTKHEEVRDIVIRFIEDHWWDGAELEIITGNSRAMKNLVIDVLREYKLEYQIGRPFDFSNKGYIVTSI